MKETLLNQDFRVGPLDERLQWSIPPRHWSVGAGLPGLVVEPENQTDFWQRTHYGFMADNGHFLGMEVRGDFELSTEVAFQPAHQYDQAGLMIRGDATCWVKASVEHELQGRPQLGAVVTNRGLSDWSLQDYPFEAPALRLRMIKRGVDVEVEFSRAEGGPWKLMRVARLHWPEADPLFAGLYACSPKAAGFRSIFTHLRVERIMATTLQT